MSKLNAYLRENDFVFGVLFAIAGGIAGAAITYTNLDRDVGSNSTRLESVESESEKQSIEISDLKELVAESARISAENGRQIAENSRLIAENGRLIAENGREIAELRETVAALTSFAVTKFDSQDEKIEKLGEEFKVLDSKSEELEDENFELKINQLILQSDTERQNNTVGINNTE